MKRLFEDAAYAPQDPFWASTSDAPDRAPLPGPTRTEVAVIGGGFTGLNAALTLAQAGRQVTVLDAEYPGFGASGRNGGFCCEGGSKLPEALVNRRFGTQEAERWDAAQRAAIDHVDQLLRTHAIDADQQPQGEVCLAHTARKARAMQTHPGYLSREQLRDMGLDGPWHGGLHTPHGFGLNPRRYVDGLARTAETAGVALHARTPVTRLHHDGQWQLHTPQGSVTADHVILATNGYSSEDLPDWLAGRTMPAQSSVITTRPLSRTEQQAAGFTSTMMVYDSRTMLHYFRLLPDGRFLFGMRGGLDATPRAQAHISDKIRKDFRAMFPAWNDVEITHEWSGLVCLMRSLVPFCGAVPGHPGLFAAMGYHGNGVAMGSYLGHHVARRLLGQADTLPEFLSTPPKRFPLGMRRRLLLRPAYWLSETFDL